MEERIIKDINNLLTQLFQKITDAGYTFDFENKKLKKIEKKTRETLGTIGGISPNWREEDKDFMYDTLSNLTELKDRYGEGYGNVGKCIDWLKSLRPQNRWKPSGEQLNALHDSAVYVDKSMFPYPKGILMKLYKQIKKLKEG